MSQTDRKMEEILLLFSRNSLNFSEGTLLIRTNVDWQIRWLISLTNDKSDVLCSCLILSSIDTEQITWKLKKLRPYLLQIELKFVHKCMLILPNRSANRKQKVIISKSKVAFIFYSCWKASVWLFSTRDGCVLTGLYNRQLNLTRSRKNESLVALPTRHLVLN